MTLRQFKLIQAAYHPELGQSSVNDKCHQLRYAINVFNQAAKKAFTLGKDLSFDEGEFPSWSHFCPVKIYNGNKPDKVCVELFFLSNTSKMEYVNQLSDNNFVGHIDVYQRKNAKNVGVSNETATLPTTQKAVINAVLQGVLQKTQMDAV